MSKTPMTIPPPEPTHIPPPPKPLTGRQRALLDALHPAEWQTGWAIALKAGINPKSATGQLRALENKGLAEQDLDTHLWRMATGVPASYVSMMLREEEWKAPSPAPGYARERASAHLPAPVAPESPRTCHRCARELVRGRGGRMICDCCAETSPPDARLRRWMQIQAGREAQASQQT